jgi:hypothetical protein
MAAQIRTDRRKGIADRAVDRLFTFTRRQWVRAATSGSAGWTINDYPPPGGTCIRHYVDVNDLAPDFGSSRAIAANSTGKSWVPGHMQFAELTIRVAVVSTTDMSVAKAAREPPVRCA